jgi:hypothetical protein
MYANTSEQNATKLVQEVKCDPVDETLNEV